MLVALQQFRKFSAAAPDRSWTGCENGLSDSIRNMRQAHGETPAARLADLR